MIISQPTPSRVALLRQARLESRVVGVDAEAQDVQLALLELDAHARSAHGRRCC